MTDNEDTEKQQENEPSAIIPRVIEDEMKQSYLDYAMSVIVGRALPDVRDGLKPVHKRVLWAMYEMGVFHNKPYRKSARIVGDCLGKYHPHGDSAVYDTMVRMAQDFSLRYPLIDGHGNWGSIDGDRAAAMRYCVSGDSRIITEKGLEKIQNVSNTENTNIRILSKDKQIHYASKWFDSGEHPTLKITTNKGYSLTGTYNHPVLTLQRDETGKPSFAWKLMEEMQEGDIVVIDRSPDNFWPTHELDLRPLFPGPNSPGTPRQLPKSLNENVAGILGAFLAEGSMTPIKMEFCNSDSDWLQDIQHRWKTEFPDSTLHKFDKKPNSYGHKDYSRLECHYRYVLEFFRKIGLASVKSAYRRVPEVIFRSPKQIVATFLRHYFEGDGTITHSPKMIELGCCSASEKLIDDLQLILLRFGIDGTKRYDKHRTIWKLYLRGQQNVLRFYKEIGFISSYKNKKLEYVVSHYKKDSSLTDYVPYISDYCRSHSQDSFVKKHNFDRYGSMSSNHEQVSAALLKDAAVDVSSVFQYLLTYQYLFEPVVAVEQETIQKVYSIRVDSTCHSFISNGFISHNTECRLKKISEELLQDLDKDTIDFTDNFDGTLKEPLVIPCKAPNLLINGSSGIAVGMATNMPPHNLTEVCGAVKELINNPEATVPDLMKHITGPDFPTGGTIAGLNGLSQAYHTGHGKVIINSKTHVETVHNRDAIIVDEIPYMVNKSQLLEQIADLVRAKKIQGIHDLRDESDRNGIRVVIELNKDTNTDVLINQLNKHSRLRTTFGITMLALVDNEPKLLTLKDLLFHFLTHRQDVVRRRTAFELRKAEEKAHLLEGLIKALAQIDKVIELIKQSSEASIAKTGLMTLLTLSEKQAQAILDMRLSRLTSLEQNKIKKDYNELIELIAKLKEILASEERILGIIKDEMDDLIATYGDDRRTELSDEEIEDFVTEDLIEEENQIITVTNKGYAKRTSLDLYRQQNRGGKGVIAAQTKEEDVVEHLFVANTHSYLLCFTNTGVVHWLKVWELPEGGRTSRGKPLVNLVNLTEGEHISAVLPVKEFNDDQFLFFCTRKGIVKKTPLSAFSRPRKGGIKAIVLENDDLITTRLTNGTSEVILASSHGLCIRFNEADVRSMGRNSRGVIGMRLKKDDTIVGLMAADESKTILTITENGFGKRTPVSDYRRINRGGMGVINIKTSERNGNVVSVNVVDKEDEVMLISAKGIMIRMSVKNISKIGRNTQGVTVMRLGSDDKVVACARILKEI